MFNLPNSWQIREFVMDALQKYSSKLKDIFAPKDSVPIIIDSSNTTLVQDSTKGTSPFSASYGYSNITVSDLTDEDITEGRTIIVKCSGSLVVTSSYRNTQIRFGSSGTYYPLYGTTSVLAGSTYLSNGQTRMFIFRKDIVSTGAWHLFTDSNSTYSPASLGSGYGTCSTAASTTAKVVSLSSYSLVTGGTVKVRFTNSVPASSTLNINSKGAKPIYYKDSAITDGIIKAGDIATFVYDGSRYRLISLDSFISELSGLATLLSQI